MQIDLTPFGFTPTETLAYRALLGRGPSSGYAVAKVLSIARANAYQALDGLAAKGAAEVASREPKVYRAVRPDALFATIVGREASKLDLLHTQIGDRPDGKGDLLVPITSLRGFGELATRWLVRLPLPVVCVAPALVLSTLAPVWRKRAADGHETVLWLVGESGSADFAVTTAGMVAPEQIGPWFSTPAALMSGGDAAIAVTLSGSDISGYWSCDPVWSGSIRLAIEHLITAASRE